MYSPVELDEWAWSVAVSIAWVSCVGLTRSFRSYAIDSGPGEDLDVVAFELPRLEWGVRSEVSCVSFVAMAGDGVDGFLWLSWPVDGVSHSEWYRVD